MTARKIAATVAVFALLAVTTSAHAATIQWDIINQPAGDSVLNQSAISGFFDLTLIPNPPDLVFPNSYGGTVSNWYISAYSGLSSGNFTPLLVVRRSYHPEQLELMAACLLVALVR